MNFVALVGRTTKDFSVFETKNGMKVAKSTVAVDKGFGDKKKTSFIGITVFGKTAEFCDRYVKKGDAVELTGSIDTGSYKKSDGTTVYTTDILVDEIKKLSSGSSTRANTSEKDNFVQYAEPQAEPQLDGFAQVDIDMPF